MPSMHLHDTRARTPRAPRILRLAAATLLALPLAAGAQVLRSNTFCSSSGELSRRGVPHRAEDVARAGAELLRAAARGDEAMAA